MSEHLTDLPRFDHTNEDGREYQIEIVEFTVEEDRIVEIKFDNIKSYEEGHVFEVQVYDSKDKPSPVKFIVTGFDGAYAMAARLDSTSKTEPEPVVEPEPEAKEEPETKKETKGKK